MKKQITLIWFVAVIALFGSCKNQQADSKNADNNATESSSIAATKTTGKEADQTAFNKDDYTEYLICTVDGVKYAVGNNSDISTAIMTLNIGRDLQILTSNGDFVPGISQEINLQLQSFDKTAPKDYDISVGAPVQVYKLNGTDAHFITTTKQTGAIHVTEIKDGFVYGHFECTATGEEDKTKSITVTDGEFKIRLKEK